MWISSRIIKISPGLGATAAPSRLCGSETFKTNANKTFSKQMQMQMKLSEQMQIRLYKMASGYIIDFSNIYDQVRSDS